MGNQLRWIGIYSGIGLIIAIIVFIVSKIIELSILVWIVVTFTLTFNSYMYRCRNCGSLNCFEPDKTKTIKLEGTSFHSTPEVVGFSTIEDGQGNVENVIKHYENRNYSTTYSYDVVPLRCKICGALEDDRFKHK